ncbi:MAG: response regulator [Candidatus Solibacter sp.]|nr:response regulator [Candidatus Solibacter sp.]
MAGEPILIVDDTPVNLKLTRILLMNEGYAVRTAASAEEALDLLRAYHPRLILADIQLPGIDGLEMTRRIKQDEGTRDIAVVALTAFAMKGDEQKAIDAGCDGYITKPIDTRALGGRIRQFLAHRAGSDAAAVDLPPGREAIPDAEMQALRRRFLHEGQERARQLLLDLDQGFNANDAARAVHQWVGTGGLLGYTALARLAYDVEVLLLERPVDAAQVRESITHLLLAFNTPPEALDAPLSSAIAQALSGKCAAIVGLPSHETQRLGVALQRARVRAIPFELTSPAAPAALAQCDLVVTYIRPGGQGSAWLDPSSNVAGLPTVFVGHHDDLAELDPAVQGMATEFLMDSWQPEEALVRLSLALTHCVPRPARPAPTLAGAGRIRVLVADDDSIVLALVRTTLQNFGMECHLAADGPKALDAARSWRPQAAILDVNMPGMDGYEVLAAIRAENLPVRVMLLTARQQESDVIRGFTLGADDYVVKPFSPLELVARLKRLTLR